MNRNLILFALILISAAGYAQKSVYQSNSFESLSKDHKILAIIPFTARLHLENGSSLSAEEKAELQHREGVAVQQALESYFLKRERRKDYRVDFQNTENTNAILAKAGITPESLDIHTIQELSEILGVDGIVSGDLDVNTLISKGVDTTFSFIDYFSGKSNYGRIAIKLSDGDTGKLLWKFEQTIDRKSGKDTDAIIEKMMRTSTRKFPYRKQRNQEE